MSCRPDLVNTVAALALATAVCVSENHVTNRERGADERDWIFGFNFQSLIIVRNNNNKNNSRTSTAFIHQVVVVVGGVCLRVWNLKNRNLKSECAACQSHDSVIKNFPQA